MAETPGVAEALEAPSTPPSAWEEAVARGVTCRELPINEWPTLLDFPGCPFQVTETLPDPRYARVMVLESVADGRIVGCWMTTTMPILEALYIDPSYRNRPTSARKLLTGMLRLLQEQGVRSVLTVTQVDSVATLAAHTGFKPLPGTLHTLLLAEG